MDINGEKYYVNYSQVTQHKNLLAVTRLLATDMMKNSYVNVGKYIQNISDDDLRAILETCDDAHPRAYEDAIIMTEMLSSGEGCDSAETQDQMMNRVDQFIMFLTIESLKRKGFVEVFYDNMSFHEDSKEKIVVRKI